MHLTPARSHRPVSQSRDTEIKDGNIEEDAQTGFHDASLPEWEMPVALSHPDTPGANDNN